MRLLLFIMLLFTVTASGQSFAQENHKTVNPDNLSEILQSNAGQKQVLLVYASWCPHCQIIFPELVEIEKIHPDSVLAISMDRDIDRFQRFMKQFPNSPITPLVWDTGFHLGASLNELDINFPGFIPFVALIDKNGKAVQQGHITADEIKAFLQ